MKQMTIDDYLQEGNLVFRSLACHQIDSLIKKGIYVDELKIEWYRRWKLEYPKYKDMSGVKVFM